MITQQDKNLVNKLAGDTFGHHSFKNGVYPADEIINRELSESTIALPEFNSLNNIKKLFAEMNLSPSLAYIRKFHGEAMFLGFRRKTSTVGDVANRLSQKWSGEFYQDSLTK